MSKPRDPEPPVVIEVVAVRVNPDPLDVVSKAKILVPEPFWRRNAVVEETLNNAPSVLYRSADRLVAPVTLNVPSVAIFKFRVVTALAMVKAKSRNSNEAIT